MKPEPKAAPAEKPKKTAAAEAQGASTAKPMSLGFGRKPAPAAGKVSSGRYAANVRAAIGRHRPGVRGGGSATVAFSIGPAGGLQGVQIVRSSGKPALDQAAIATVRSAAPFPPPPARRQVHLLDPDLFPLTPLDWSGQHYPFNPRGRGDSLVLRAQHGARSNQSPQLTSSTSAATRPT